ncbi:hypothetical protein V5O48_013025 [Marasmius crinis-equi]|uniref:F-box domain-containing protein n=1 Tax=Marasmius crinis-equi TaxID=585013 RepID=A0ABR3F1M0_9AGAR
MNLQAPIVAFSFSSLPRVLSSKIVQIELETSSVAIGMVDGSKSDPLAKMGSSSRAFPSKSDSYYTLADLPGVKSRMKDDIEALHSKAADLEQAAGKARRKKLELVSALNSLENLSSAIFSLPDELLIVIFERVVDADTGGHTMSKHAAPWVLSQTCRGWRQLALSTPSLWTLMRIDTFLVPKDPIRILKAWLERSQTLPLSCLLFMGQPPSGADVREEILQVIMGHSHRWRHLDIDLESRSDLYVQLASRKLDFPFLQSIRLFINVPNASSDTVGLSFPPATITAPLLLRAFLMTLIPSMPDPTITLPWGQLVELSMSFVTSAKFSDIVAGLTHIECCSLRISSRFVLTAQTVTFPTCLRRLELAGPLSNVIHTLSHLISPGLEALAVGLPDGSTVPSLAARRVLDAILRIQTRSSCRLRCLHIPITLFSSPDSLRSTESLSAIQVLYLRLQGEAGSHEAVRTFKTSDIFRNMEELHLIVDPGGIGDIYTSFLPDFMDMVDARVRESRVCTRLGCLEIDVVKSGADPKPPLPVTMAIAERLSRLQRDGLTLVGCVKDGKWLPRHPTTTSWQFEAFERRWAQFGYSDWLLD